MIARIRVALVVSALVVAAPALACQHGFHSHSGVEAIAINLGGLRLFSIGVSVAHAPCPQVAYSAPVYRPAPQVFFAPPPVYVEAPPVSVEPPPVYVEPPPLVVAPPPVFLPAPPPPPQVVVMQAPVYVQAPPKVAAPAAPAPVPVVVAQPRRVEEGPNLLAFKYARGLGTSLDTTGAPSLGTDVSVLSSLGVELRLARWFALRSDVELRPDGRSYDFLGVKLSLDRDSALRPYASASITGEHPTARPGFSYLGVVGAVGVDLFLGRYFFLAAEARVRAVHDCCGVTPVASASVGGGIAFF